MRSFALVLMLTSTVSAERAAPPKPVPQRAPMPDPTFRDDVAEPPRPLPPAPVKPAAEVAAQAKLVAGTWACKGVRLRGDGSSMPATAAMTAKLDLDGAWIAYTMTETAGAKLVEYRTFDGTAKQWTRVQMSSASAVSTTTSLGPTNGTWTWTGTQQSPAGTLQVRDMEQPAGRSLKLWGEAMLGGTWQKLYDVTCTK